MNIMTNNNHAGAVLAVALTVGASGFVAADSGAEGWQFELTPYVWAAALSGDVQAGRLPKTDFSVNASDVISNTDMAWMGAFEARNDRWGVLVDTLYLDLSDDSSAVSRTGPLGNTLHAKANADVKEVMASVAGAYRVTEGRVPVDIVGGLRYVEVKVDGNIDASLYPEDPNIGGAKSFGRSGSVEWVDPYVGARVKYPVTDSFDVVGYADVGGGGIGANFAAQALIGVNYEFSKMITGKLGYRYWNENYDKGGIIYDIEAFGWYLGAGFRF